MNIFKKRPSQDSFFACVSGLVFLLMFIAAYRTIPDHYYQNRDDALITFSHARNLADYGFVGVNPSGGRVEGYSTPLQFFLFFAAYKVAGIPFEIFTHWQTLLCAFFLGFMFIKFFKSDYAWGLALSLIAAALCTKDPSFLEWHGSGMENSLVHVAYFGSLYFLYKMIRERRIVYFSAVIFFLASMARVESIYYLGPLLLLFSFLWRRREKSSKGFLLALAVFLSWGLFNAFRYLYFGDLFPNSAYAKSIDVVGRILSLLKSEAGVADQSLRLLASVFTAHHGFVLALSLPLFLLAKKSKEFGYIIILCSIFIVLTLLTPFIFGPSSLDATRTSSPMAVLVIILFCFSAFQLRTIKAGKILFPVLSLSALSLTAILGHKPYPLNWSPADFAGFRSGILDLQLKHNLFRPLVANPDLGFLSWTKDFNILDLGKIGDPVLSRLGRPQLIADYIFEFAAPDMIELHDGWACAYAFLFSDPRFPEMYLPANQERTEWLKANCPQEEVKTGIWIRKAVLADSTSRERQFMDNLRTGLSIQKVKEELNICKASDPAGSSLYVTRSVFRHLPEFVEKGEFPALRSLFSGTRTSRYDLAVLAGRNSARWYKDIGDVVREHNLQKNQRSVRKSKIIGIRNYPFKSGFLEGDIWTDGDASVLEIGFQIFPETTQLAIETYSFRPASLQTRERLNLHVYADDVELEFVSFSPSSYLFRIPKNADKINRIRIVSDTFVPKKEGLNTDERKLGLDIKTIEFR